MALSVTCSSLLLVADEAIATLIFVPMPNPNISTKTPQIIIGRGLALLLNILLWVTLAIINILIFS